MSGPWEKFQQVEPQGKPWEKFRTADTAVEAVPEDGSMVGNLAGGLVRGAGSIGATVLAPYDIAKDAFAGKGLTLESNRARRAGIDGGLREIGADPDSGAYQAGKLIGEIAGTAGVPGLIEKGAQLVGAAPKVVSAAQSAGFSLGAPTATTAGGKIADMALRTAAGGATGVTAAGLVDPESAGTGALIGAALPGAVKAAGAVGRGIKSAASNTFGATTGTSAEAVSAAFQAGKSGSDDFLKHVRGKAEFDEVVTSAKQGLEKMRADRAAQYRSGMLDIRNDKSVLDFKPIDDAMSRVVQIGQFKGVPINKNAAGVVDDLAQTVSQWKTLNPAEYHTPEGLDALKRAIGDIRDATQFGTPARRAADSVYSAVKDEITKQAPTYAKVMKDYSKASDALDEITKSLSLGDKATKDTAIRKLQSLMRNNAQASYGNRLSLASQLEQQGGVDLMPAVAGQAMNSWTPRGMTGAIQKAGAAGLGGASFVNPGLLPAFLLAPATSPRLVGETAYGLGRLSGGTSKLSQALLSAAPNQMRELALQSARVAPVISLGSRTVPQETR